MALQTPRNPLRLALIALLALALAACTSASESGREGGGGEGSGEHGGGGEGSERGEGGGGDGEEAAVQLSPTQTFWTTRKGVRLDLRYDAATQSFRGSATNITGAPIPRVRVEVHLSNGVELGPTTTMGPRGRPDHRRHAAGDRPDIRPMGRACRERRPRADGSVHPPRSAPGPSSTRSSGHRAPDPSHERVVYRRPAAPGRRIFPRIPPRNTSRPGAATWTGEWAGIYGTGSTVSTGAASVTVTLGTSQPRRISPSRASRPLTRMQWNDMTVTDGRFTGSTSANSNTYDAVGQFGGANQAGVVDTPRVRNSRSVFYGNKD